MSDATIVTRGGRPAVRLERHLHDPIFVVWEALTDREQLRRWFPCDVIVAHGNWEIGASISFVFPPDVIDITLTGEVLTVDQPARLAFTWGEEVLRFELSPEAGGTRLVLFDELPPDAAARNAAGWEDCLDRLMGLPPAPHAWRSRFDAYCSTFEPVLGPQEGPPPGYQGESQLN
jgi:uncharacterized protein YndB with AHSA1/START domain